MRMWVRNVILVAVGFLLGAVVTASLMWSPARLPVTRTSGPTFVATGPVVAAASIPARFVTNISNLWTLPPHRVGVLNRDLDEEYLRLPFNPPTLRSMGLIDHRYQPNPELDDLGDGIEPAERHNLFEMRKYEERVIRGMHSEPPLLPLYFVPSGRPLENDR